MKYTFNLEISNDKREHTEKLIVGAFDNESSANIALKLLAYVMFIEKRPRIDEDAGWQFIPDLIARDDSGEIRLCVDCGGISTKKIDMIGTKGRDNIDFYVFRKTAREMEQFYQVIKDKVKDLDKVKCVSFDDGFVDVLGDNLDRTNNVHGYVSDDMVTVTVTNSFGKHEAYSTIHRIEPGTDS